ncbi:MAG: DUF4153 domain-containing protein [Actinomycetota bacterium]
MSSSARHDALVAGAVVLCGVAAGWLLPGVDLGLGMPVLAVVIAATIYIADRRDITRYDVLCGVLALLLTAVALLRAAEWLVALCLLAAMGLSVVAVTRVKVWRGVFAAPIAVIARFTRVPVLVVRPIAHVVAGRDMTRFGPVARGTAAAIFSVVLFGTLFATADAAFARLAQDWLIPRWDLNLLPARVVTGVIVTFVVGALILAKPRFAPEWLGAGASSWDSFITRAEPREAKTRSVAEWAIPVIALDVLFASFVAIQISVLFGGRDHVEVTDGLTYAEYARQGFFQLLAVAALVLVVIAAVIALGRPREGRDRTLMRWSLGALCGLTLVVLASALVRLQLYEETFGFTRLRVSVHATIYWLAGIFVLVIVSGIRWRAGWLPRAVVAYTAVSLLAFAVVDPEALIARENVRRFDETGRIDVGYLSTLSADPVPHLLELPTDERNCVLFLSGDPVPEPQPWNGFNLARLRARDALKDVVVPEDGSYC